MVREFSSGGAVLRRRSGQWWIAVIEPARPGSASDPPNVLALPKGNVDEGEKPLQTALREVREETGVTAEFVAKLTDIKYFYVRTWANRERVFKVVSFFLLKYKSGRLDEIAPEMRKEVRRALWMRLDEAPDKLSYRGERDVVRLAIKYLAKHEI